MSIRVRKVESRRDLQRFIRLPWRIYAGDPNWVPPLIMDVRSRLDRKKHPFFAHAEADYFLAERDGEVAGRVAAVVNRRHNAAHGEKIVFFGFFESVNDPGVARALLDAAAAWGRERGMDTLRGPASLSLNDECALLVEGFDSPPAVMMPYNPRYYSDLLTSAGLVKAKDLYAFFLDRGSAAAERIRPVVERVRASGEFTIRKIDQHRAVEEARAIAAIYNDGWHKNWGFVPWTEDEMKHMVRDLVRFADPDIILFAEHHGRPVGFACGLPNFNEVLAKMNGRLLPFGWISLPARAAEDQGRPDARFRTAPELLPHRPELPALRRFPAGDQGQGLRVGRHLLGARGQRRHQPVQRLDRGADLQAIPDL